MSNLEKKHFGSQEKEQIISEWKQSGLSKKQFSEERGIKYCTFVGWFQGTKKETSSDGFSEVVISAGEKIFMEVVSGSRTLRFFQPPSKEYLMLLLQ